MLQYKYIIENLKDAISCTVPIFEFWKAHNKYKVYVLVYQLW